MATDQTHGQSEKKPTTSGNETGSGDAVKPDDGGQAFPTAENEWHHKHPGMSMRDYFAGHAMQGLLANPKVMDFPAAELLDISYGYADAALERRKR